jgi:hypothetical protein
VSVSLQLVYSFGVVDFILSVILDGAIGKSMGSSAESVECSFRLIASFILYVCDRQHPTASFEKDMIGVKPERLSTPQGSWAAKCAIRSGQAVGRRDMASVEFKMGPVLHPETRRTG